jgi:uncharacterized protein DUF397
MYKKASFSGNGSQCVEVDFIQNGTRVRDSKDPNGPFLFFTRGEWGAFVKGVKNSEFDNPLN